MEQGGCEDTPCKQGLEEKVKQVEKDGRKAIEKKGKGWAAQRVLRIPLPGAYSRKPKHIANNHLDRLEVLIWMDVTGVGRQQGEKQPE